MESHTALSQTYTQASLPAVYNCGKPNSTDKKVSC